MRTKVWTVDDLGQLDEDDQRYEVVDGRLEVSPQERFGNTMAGWRLEHQLAEQAPPGVAAVREMTIRLGTNSRVADIVLLRTDGASRDDRIGCEAADVLLAVEVVSPDSRRRDRIDKPREYAAAGIAAYWLLEPDPAMELHTFVLDGGVYRPDTVLSGVGQVRAPSPMTIDVPGLLRRGRPGGAATRIAGERGGP